MAQTTNPVVLDATLQETNNKLDSIKNAIENIESVSSLAELEDVSIPNPQKDQVLTYDGTEWVADDSKGGSAISWVGTHEDWKNDSGNIPKAKLEDKSTVIFTDDFNGSEEVIYQLTKVVKDVGDVDSLTTTNKNDVVSAVNEVNTSLTSLTNLANSKLDKRMNSVNYTFGFETFNGVVISGTTYNNVELVYQKCERTDGRYWILGAVVSGSQLWGRLLHYNSVTNKWVVVAST